jgi:mannose-6-phosphate isomerase
VEQRSEVTLVDGPLFRLDRIDGPPSELLRPLYAGAPLLVIPREVGVVVGGVELAVGECALARDIDEVAVEGGALALLAKAL